MTLERGDLIGGRFKVTSDGPISTWVLGRDEKCKSVQCGGSHYHCTRCGAVTSMYGHSSPERCQKAVAKGLGDPEWVS